MLKNIKLTPTQKERINSIVPILGDSATEVVTNLKGRGRSSWKSTLANILLINNPSSIIERNYYESLDEAIDTEEVYTSESIIHIVSDTRYKNGMTAFTSKIEANCLNEVFKLFLWDDAYDQSVDDVKPVFLGYKPICRLLK